MKRLLLPMAFALLLGACDVNDDAHRVVGELASDRVELTAEFNEPIVEIRIAEGAPVTAGQVLVVQDSTRATAALAEAIAAHRQTEARLDELVRGPRSEQIAAARANAEGGSQELVFRQKELARVKDVHTRGLASAESLDRAVAALDAAQANLKLRLAQLDELLTGTTIEELAQTEQAVKQAAARRDRAEIDVERHTLRAPVDAIVDSRLFEVGERPAIGQPVVTLLAGNQVYARVYIPETLRVQIQAGTPAIVHVDGLPQALSGEVRWVSSEAAFTPYFALTERDRRRLSYLAKVDLTEKRQRLPDGVPVEVEFALGQER